ncbi:MAG TPA: SURF1 family protein [Luteimonas sp.]|nr:SURF1 family protein [Luteimonas sp.]
MTIRVSRNRVLLWALALLVIALFTRLGVWLLARMHEKQAMLAASRAVLAERRLQPLAIAGDPQRARTYDWAGGAGRFVDAPAVLLDNQARDGRIGVHAYRAFQLAGGPGPLVLVDLGWLPLAGDRRMPAIAQPQGTLRLSGLLAPPPSPGLASDAPVRQADGTLLTVALSIPALRQALRVSLAPRVLKLDPALPLGYARDLDILPNTMPPERHLGYAVQWFGLALTVLVTALVLTFRKPRSHPTP